MGEYTCTDFTFLLKFYFIFAHLPKCDIPIVSSSWSHPERYKRQILYRGPSQPPTDAHQILLKYVNYLHEYKYLRLSNELTSAELLQGYTRKVARYNLEPHIIRPTARIDKYRPAYRK